jgi:hypothetical protein
VTTYAKPALVELGAQDQTALTNLSDYAEMSKKQSALFALRLCRGSLT